MIDFDTGDDTLTGKIFDEVLAVVGKLTGGLVEEDDAVDVVCETVGGEENITIVTAIVIGVGNT